MQRELSRHSPPKLNGYRGAALHLFVICAAWIVIWSPCDLASEGPGLALGAIASRPGNDRVLESIRERGRAIYKNYAGVRSIRHSAIRVYDGGSGDLLERVEISANRMDYYDAPPEARITAYVLDGNALSPDAFENQELDPPYPVFDERGAERYRTSIVGAAEIDGVDCWRLRVEPRRNGRRYFRGDMYFAKRNLALRFIAGTFARLQFGLREFYFEFSFSGRGPAPVFERGFARGTVHVPLILHKSFTSRMVFENQTLVRR